MSEELSEYQTLLRKAYLGEHFGDGFFGALAEKQPDPERREKLETLQTVEARTATSLRRLASSAHVLGDEQVSHRSGAELAAGLDPADWDGFVKGLLQFLPDFLADFERLRDIGGAPVDPALTALVNHERAIQQFAELELEGKPEKSLKPLQDHLRTPA
jgi:hypothetical protein